MLAVLTGRRESGSVANSLLFTPTRNSSSIEKFVLSIRVLMFRSLARGAATCHIHAGAGLAKEGSYVPRTPYRRRRSVPVHCGAAVGWDHVSLGAALCRVGVRA